MGVQKHIFHSKTESKTFFRAFAHQLRAPCIVLVQGRMGAGKSQTVKWLTGSSESSSPSYALHHTYKSGSKTFEHFDLDRLQNEDDLESTGFWDIFAKTDSIVLIEWPERLKVEQLPPKWPVTTIHIQSFDDSEKREFTISDYAALR